LNSADSPGVEPGTRRSESGPDSSAPALSTSGNFKRNNTYLAILRTGVVIVALCGLSLAFRPARLIPDTPLSEDAFYALTIARNIAEGRGIVIEGSTWTNGFQPLFVFSCAPIWGLVKQDKILPIRLILGFSWLLYIGSAYLMAQIAGDFAAATSKQDNGLRWAAVLLYLSAPILVMAHFNGLETGCLLFCYAAVWRFYQQYGIDTTRRLLGFGALLGLLVLARIDTVFLVVIICLAQMFEHPTAPWRDRLSRFFALAIVSFAVSSPWWFYNLLKFHSLMPSSGQAEQMWGLSQDRLDAIVYSLGRVLLPWGYGLHYIVTLRWLGLLVPFLLLALAFVFYLRFGHRSIRNRLVDTSCTSRGRRTLQFARWLLVSFAVLACWYTLSSWTIHFYIRYLTPLAILSVFAGVQIYSIVYRRSVRVAVLSLVIPTLCAFASTAAQWEPERFFVGIGNPCYRDQLELVETHVPQNAWVAAGQSGTLGYFRNHVINLDGKVNPVALEYQRKMPEYLRQLHVNYLCDWQDYVDAYLGEHPGEIGWRKVGEKAQFVLYRYDEKR